MLCVCVSVVGAVKMLHDEIEEVSWLTLRWFGVL